VEKTFANATVTASGLKYVVETPGTGLSPTDSSNVTVHYTGMFLDGRIFDSSVQRGPVTYPLKGFIVGWQEGLKLMKEGQKNKFFIPSSLAYGEAGFGGGAIPPNTPLLFEVELIKVNDHPKK
jgi:peptidyl-prolyl cis-trans isomerase A (cyclophilin A)